MIKSVSIKNFKSHKDSTILLTSGVNSIFGDSDSGKSAIIKALYWCINNQPSGDSFINNPKIPTIVAIELNNGTIIEREKSKSNNKYTIINGEDRQEFKSFNQGVPDEIKNLLKIKQFNFQSQFDDHFLLSNSSGEVAKFFNDVIDLDIIDTTFENILKDDSRVKTEIKRLKNDLEEINKKEMCFEWIDSADNELIQIEKIDNKILTIEPKISTIKSNIFQIKISEAKLLQYKDLEKIELKIREIDAFTKKLSMITPKITSLKNKIREIKELEKEKQKYKNLNVIEQDIKKILDLTDKITPIKKDIKAIKEIVNEISKIESKKKYLNIDNIEKEYGLIAKLNTSVIKVKGEKQKLLSVITKIKESEIEISRIISKIKVAEDKILKLLPEICPLCGSKTK